MPILLGTLVSITPSTATAALLGGGTVATAGMSGAIFTTNADGTWVNGNVYDSADLVYLNGGPRANQNCWAAGLPDGDYYFQVTDPPGKVLLSTDDIKERKIRVADGVISKYLGFTHATGEGPCSGVTVALGAPDPDLLPPPDPLLDGTPNPGGEYKVWLTLVGSYKCMDPTLPCGGSFGFISSASKTDNFKVQPPEGVPD